MFNVNQIVKGKKAGMFVILALRAVGGEDGVQVKPVNPNDWSEVGAGEFWLPVNAVEAVE